MADAAKGESKAKGQRETEFRVLRGDSVEGEDWYGVEKVSAPNQGAAKRKVAARLKGENGRLPENLVLVAIPERSWKPEPVREKQRDPQLIIG